MANPSHQNNTAFTSVLFPMTERLKLVPASLRSVPLKIKYKDTTFISIKCPLDFEG